ncbi:putative bifunctional diguanylate cyclase/phosphodiesterase [Marinobacterium lutimaris]|uniref:Diguanylate cyclase (GGDEF) domain-containing protein n=1 Tax=Marinobacterium lutimaris TaxID=568106 RepID=A0A1H6D9U7_9GAMM|nr:EAL domain-containing protein [Marinobacterium lutimaris]SEG82257.1 diguanylate cyclase (GGDEF) domain-containing protein [Marinobacterium lutimaris]
MQPKEPISTLSNLSIRRKLLLMVTLSLFCILATALLAAFLHHNDLIDARKREVRSIVEVVGGQLNEVYAQHQNGAIDDAQLLVRAHELLDPARYRHNNYLFLLTDEGKMLINVGRPSLEGKSFSDLRDSEGNPVLPELLQAISERDQTFWRYRWAQLDQSGNLTPASDKLSYFMRISDSNWLLGSGVHLDDIQSQLFSRLLSLAILTLALLLATLLVALAISRNIANPLRRLAQATQEISNARLEIEVEDSRRQDEIGALARAIQQLRDHAQENRRLRNLSEHARFLEEFDPVTRLYNRQSLGDALEREITRQQRQNNRLAVLVIRLVLLRDITTRWGPDCGNQVLRTIVDRLRNHLRVDDILGRHGDDTLTLVRPEAGDNDAIRTLMRELLEEISAPITIDDQPFNLQGRIGVSLYPEDGDQEFQLVGRAEEALRAARRAERDWYWFNNLASAPVDQRLGLWREIQVAMEEDQFYLVFQPVFDLQSNQANSAEVLLRWRHPEKGLISPAVFIPFAEQTGLVKRIDQWVLEAVARQLRSWQEQGLSMPLLAINLSGISFLRADLEQHLRTTFHGDTGLLSHLVLELTEGVLIEDMDRIQLQVEQVRQLGVKVAIDDFGTGYSSLSRIRNLPIDHIKIDQSFIEDIVSNPQCTKIVEAIMLMAHGLRLQVIAEGVEHEDQLHLLRQMGCDLVQGYLLSHPLERREFETMLQQDLEIDLEID